MREPILTFSRYLRGRVLAAATALLFVTVPATASDQMYFPAVDNVTNVLVNLINAETVRIDIATWYLSEGSVAIAVAKRWNAGVPVRLIGDRGAIFEADPHTKDQFYWLANQGVPIKLRFNPSWYPEINHWKTAILVGQNKVLFGSGNFAPTELAPNSPSDYDDESEMVTDDPVLVGAFKTKFDRMWNDTTYEPESIYGAPPYLKNWDDACASEPTGKCSDYHTLYPNPVPMVINSARLEPDNPMPPDLIWGQGNGPTDLNQRMVTEINNENSHIELVIYRLTVPQIGQAILNRFRSGVPTRIIVDTFQYANPLWPEYELTHAYVDQLYAAGIPVRQRVHAGVTHMKTLITSNYASNASSNYGAHWQRDQDYFVPLATKPTMYQALLDRFNTMWSDNVGFTTFSPGLPDAANLASPASGATGVSTTPTLVWNRAHFATSFDVYLGTSPNSLALAGNVPAQLSDNPPGQYSFTPASPLNAGTTYYWKVVSRTFATPVNPSVVASSSTWSFSTGGQQPPPQPLPAPWVNTDVGSVGIAGSASFASGAFTVRGAGSNIWGTNDGFQYVYQTLSGDGSIVARVTAISNTSSFAKAGVMIRESTADNAAHVILDLRPTNDIEFMTRPSTGAATNWLGGATQAPPTWLQLTRSGSTVTGSVSSDGVTWRTVGSTTLSIGATATIGLIVCSQNPGLLNTSTFDNVTVSANVTPPSPPASPNPADGASGVPLNTALTWSAPGATSYDVSFGTTTPPPMVATNQASATYTPAGLAYQTTYYWQIVARNAAGTTPGPIWSFTTLPQPPPQPPAPPASPNPADGAAGVPLTPTLSWSSTGATSYDVSFGTTTPPPVVSSGQAAATYSPTGLTNSTTYYWQITAHNASGTTTGPVWTFTTAAAPPPPPTNIVIYASDLPAAAMHGSWSASADATSPNGLKLVTSDLGVSNTNNALASPTDYVDVTFTANANTPYTLWIRIQALNNSKYNDSLWVQFSDAQWSGAPIYPINTTQGLLVNLATDTNATSDQGWGWVNGAYWLSQPATVTFATAGQHTMRIQVREDGVMVDQIVLSPSQYFNTAASCPTVCTGAPGPVSNDHTIVPKP